MRGTKGSLASVASVAVWPSCFGDCEPLSSPQLRSRCPKLFTLFKQVCGMQFCSERWKWLQSQPWLLHPVTLDPRSSSFTPKNRLISKNTKKSSSSSNKQTLEWFPIVNSLSEFLQYPLCVPQYLSQKRANKAEWILPGHSRQFFYIATIPQFTIQNNTLTIHTIPHCLTVPKRMDPSRPFSVIFVHPPLTFRAFYCSPKEKKHSRGGRTTKS